ncbi:MAG: indole-3-glycerol phosphate synthase TrpC [Clostridiales bacterium]|nr:indole-3-glycerol phosphate synthase TrpC [Clostridiales bacterium]
MILNKIANSTKKRVKLEKEKVPLEKMKDMAKNIDTNFDFTFEKALKKDGVSFICEVKKASPSKGIISSDFDYIKIAKEYEKVGASCISVLTEPEFFKGDNVYLKEIRSAVEIPLLRKDFIIDEYQIYQSKTLGANAVLLICALLDTKTIEQYIKVCNSLGLCAVVEVHDEKEVQSALSANARIIGVNNRNLKDFTVDINNSLKLRNLVPSDVTFISESGIKTAKDIEKLSQNAVDAVLIGEALMRAENKKEMLDNLRGF